MKSASVSLAAFLDSRRASVIRHLVRVTLADETVIRWTDHESSITYDGNTYTAGGTGTAPLLKIGEVREAPGTSISQCELTLFCGESSTITTATATTRFPLACLDGVLDGAEVRIDMLFGDSSPDTSLGVLYLFEGLVEEAEPTSTSIRVVLVDGREDLKVKLPRTYLAPPCQAMLFDSQCALVAATFTETATISGSPTTTTVATNLTAADNYFRDGVAVFSATTTTTALRNVSRSVRAYANSGGTVTFAEPLEVAPVSGDEFDIIPGCDKRLTTCDGTFDNLVHFRGFPYVTTSISDGWKDYKVATSTTDRGTTTVSAIIREPGPETWSRALPILYGRRKVKGELIWAYTYNQAAAYYWTAWALCEGEVDSSRRLWIGPYYFTSTTDTFNISTRFNATFHPGTRPTQTVDYWMNDQVPTQALTYPSTSYLAAFLRASDPRDIYVEIDGFEVGTGDATYGDAHPADVIQDLLTNTTYGAAFPWTVVTDTGPAGDAASSYRRYASQAEFFVSPLIDTRRPALDWLQAILDATNGTCRWSEGELEIVPLGDQDVGTYDAYVTPQYDLSEDDYVTDGQSDPVTVTRRPDEESYNVIPVQFTERIVSASDPASGYSPREIENPEPLDVSLRGIRRGPAVQLDMICQGKIATAIARILAQLSTRKRNTYSFRLPWNFLRLEVCDYLRLTDAKFGLNNRTVRITSIRWDGDALAVEAEDAPIGSTTAAAHTIQSSESTAISASYQRTIEQSIEAAAVRNWTFRGGSTWANKLFSSVIYTGTKFVAVYGTDVASSTSGITWTAEASLPAGTFYGIGSDGDSLFVAVGASDDIATSTDLVTWTPRTSGTSGEDWNKVKFNGSQWVATHTLGISYSSNGTTWNSATVSGGTLYPADIAWSDTLSLWVAVGAYGNAAYSSNGSSWTYVDGPAFMDPGNSTLGDVDWSGREFVAVGWSDDGNRPVAAISTDGQTWSFTDLPTSGAFDRPLCIEWTGRIWVAGGLIDGAGGVWTSGDGRTWESSKEGGAPTDANYGWYGLAWSGRLMVAVTYGGTSGTYVVASSMVV